MDENQNNDETSEPTFGDDLEEKKKEAPAAEEEEITDFEQRASGQQIGIVREFWDFLKYNKKWWLTPIILSLLLIALLVIAGGSGAAPFIYSLF